MSGTPEIPQTDPSPIEPRIELNINIGLISLHYSGPKDFLRDLPAILAELQKFELPQPVQPQ